ncbi:MAG TPA: hypothetical protein ENN38_02700 [Actinobacteria bacterium]|nr:hypothetical protein [Actinomycetota bacterium]
MKSRKEVCGLSIIAISSGEKVGTVRDLAINFEMKQIALVVVEDPNWYKSTKVVPFDKIRSLGEDAIIIDDPSRVVVASSDGQVEQLLQKDTQLINSPVMSVDGKYSGTVTEYWFDPQTGAVDSCAVTKGNSTQTISKDKILTFGKDAIIISEKGVAEFPRRDEAPERVKEKTEVEVVEEQQKNHLIGQTIKEDILGDDGNILFMTGEIVTEEIIEKAKNANKYLELTYSVEQP